MGAEEEALSTDTAPSRADIDLEAQRQKTAQLNAKFERLAFDLGDGDDGEFISGWQCHNPHAGPLLESVKQHANHIDHTRYSYFDAHANLTENILDHHTTLDKRRPEAVLCGCGTTALLFTWAAHLHSMGVSKVYYVPPLYITLHTALDRFGIRAVPVADRQPYEPGFCLDLPDDPGCTLLLTDPVWFSGTAVAEHWIDAVGRWQLENSSTVFVDGSLQYLPWSGPRHEMTATLLPELTVRLVCPSKQLCTHGYRFSYMLAPSRLIRGLAWTYTNIFGPAPADSIAFAHAAIEAVAAGEIPRVLMKTASARFADLVRTGAIETSLNPNCGYFVFAHIAAALPSGYVQIDGSYFYQAAYPGYAKINLLSPSIGLLGVPPA